MRILWAPWRSEYIENIGKSNECFLCEAYKQPDEKLRDYLVLYKTEKAFIILNKYPYNTGHLMVCPALHLGDYRLIDGETIKEMHGQVKLSLDIIEEAFNPHGFNIGFNIGKAAGAGLETHVHLHIVPRWFGDTNFMPVFGEVKVISKNLMDVYDILKEKLEKRLNGTS